MITPLGTEQLDDYVSLSDSFEVIDNGDHFVLSFIGEDDVFQSFVTETELIDMENWIFGNESVAGSGTYEILIEKETYYNDWL